MLVCVVCLGVGGNLCVLVVVFVGGGGDCLCGEFVYIEGVLVVLVVVVCGGGIIG